MVMERRGAFMGNPSTAKPTTSRHTGKHPRRYRDIRASRDVRAYTGINRATNAMKMKASNNRLQSTSHYVRRA